MRRALAKELVRRYRRGESIRALASTTGRSYGSVHRMLVEAGVQLRRRGKPARGGGENTMAKQPTPKLPKQEEKALKAAHKEFSDQMQRERDQQKK